MKYECTPRHHHQRILMKLKSFSAKKIIIILSIVILSSVIWYLFIPHYPSVRMKGTITALDNSCWFDGTCTITLDNGCWVEIERGGMLEPGSKSEVSGNISEPLFSGWGYQNNIGKQVEIFVRKLESATSSTTTEPSSCWLSVFGSRSYYVKVL